MNDKNDGRKSDLILVTRTHEIARTARTLFWCVAIIICVWKLTNAAQLIFARPPWMTLALSALGLCGTPSGVSVILFWRVRRYTRSHEPRIARLETLIDAGRSSSGLQVDGTNRVEDPI